MTSCDKRYRHARPLTLRDHECLLLRGIPATTLHSGYDFDSLHLGHSFALGLCLGLCFYQGVRFKWGLLQAPTEQRVVGAPLSAWLYVFILAQFLSDSFTSFDLGFPIAPYIFTGVVCFFKAYIHW